MKIIFWISHFLIVWTMLIYPAIMNFLSYFIDKRQDKGGQRTMEFSKTDDLEMVTLIVAAHNEENIIEKKMKNILDLNYPKENLNVIISSDNSTDNTNEKVFNFINKNKLNWQLYEVKQRKGKTNAQNEAVKEVDNGILVFTDANTMLEPNSVLELVRTLRDKNVGYVCGNLQLISDNMVSKMERSYWNIELNVRRSESFLSSIVTGNGALYACRFEDYIEIPLIESHDSGLPYRNVISGKKALYNNNAVVYEKSASTHEDEYSRKVRMNRVMLRNILPDIKLLNFLKLGWYPIFYLSHRTLRYLLWALHLILFITSIILYPMSFYYKTVFVLHLLFYLLFFVDSSLLKTKIMKLFYYYSMTIKAQYHALYNALTGQNKPFWKKAETTRI